MLLFFWINGAVQARSPLIAIFLFCSVHRRWGHGSYLNKQLPHRRFAIRSGSYTTWAETADIEDGVTIDLRIVNSTVIIRMQVRPRFMLDRANRRQYNRTWRRSELEAVRIKRRTWSGRLNSVTSIIMVFSISYVMLFIDIVPSSLSLWKINLPRWRPPIFTSHYSTGYIRSLGKIALSID